MIAFTTHTKSESCEEHSRICFSCSKKGVFNVQERHVLEWWRASFSSKLGLSMKREGHDNWNILTIPIEMVSVLLIQRVRSISHEGAFFFSQKNTEEQNTQRFTETSSQPISQNVTANLSWKASVNSVCRRPSVGSKLCAKMLSELCALCERKISPASCLCVIS